MISNDRTSGKTDPHEVAIRYGLCHSPHSAFAATRPGSMQKVLESTPAVERLAARPKPLPALLIALAALAAAASLTAFPSAASAHAHSANTCSSARAVASACRLITRFFDALNSGDEATACAFLGVRLLVETGGANCPNVLTPNQGTPFKIISARTDQAAVLVRVQVGVHELDHWRMLNWTALVGAESGTLKILDTRRVT
jgi:hypothetical protein